MYLSTKQTFKLDEIIKSFEVGYRSFIVNKLKINFPTFGEFYDALMEANSKFEKTSILHTHKMKNKLKSHIKKARDHYNTINLCENSLKTHSYDNNVPYVSELLDYITIFFNISFHNTGILNHFSSTEEFLYHSKIYHSIRNVLSHPASNRVTIQDAKFTTIFVTKLIRSLSGMYFWYVQSSTIQSKIEEFLNQINNTNVKIHNLNEVGYSHPKIVCRENELNKLNTAILGKGEFYRTAGSFAIYGYGGVGKTALVLEFIYRLLKKIDDSEGKLLFDFILFFSSKDELLKVSKVSGEFQLAEINKQIDSFSDFQQKLYKKLAISNIEEVGGKYNRGLIVIDNLENLSEQDKESIFQLIKRTPLNTQYLITSRNEEPSDDDLNLKEFRKLNDGKKFIEQYIDQNDLDVILSDDEINGLLAVSKGNTLILVLSLLIIKSGKSSIDKIISELQFIESKNIEIIADFMYKNTFEKALEELEKEGYSPRNLVKVISLYDEPVDLYSASKLAKMSITDAEYICRKLISKLVLDKRNEQYTINEFANSFILIKLLPDKIELGKEKSRIREHKKRIKEQLENLSLKRKKNKKLADIMDDWTPRNYIDKVAIAEVFGLFDKAKIIVKNNNKDEAKKIIQIFNENEKMTNHPYIKFTKARVFSLLLPLWFGKEKERKKKETVRYFEDAIQSIEFSYLYMRNTKSHGAVLWIFGTYIKVSIPEEIQRSTNFLEQARDIFKNLPNAEKNYLSVIGTLVFNYSELLNKTKDRAYRHKIKFHHKIMANNKSKIIRLGYNYERYIKRYNKLKI
ncbi:ATP-binding protein [Aureispira anguillae]|uniref:ATP-binding protein n=1 Tax=Aureispira anguillae TaxID=2864201 RepID=A0A916DU41_9BACT|nr:ATP-binding protein [Aureispira anguillae]BDS12357.1 ATP-binding protein [Aureispira anguillae]